MDPEILKQLWIASKEMITEAGRKGLNTERAVRYLRTAKSILNECASDKKAKKEFLDQASRLIDSAQREVFLASQLGKEFLEKWDEEFKMIMQGKKIGEFPVLRSSKFYPSLPRGKNWVRIPASKEIENKLKEMGIDVRHHHGNLLILGDKEHVKKALKEISHLFKR
jgi:hypothetical protein